MARSLLRRGFVLCLFVASCAQAPPGSLQPRRAEAHRTAVPDVRGQEPTTMPASAPDAGGYRSYGEMTATLHALAASSSAATLESLATTVGEREVWALTIALDGPTPPEQRRALLVVGGVDADHPAGSETAVNVARRLIAARVEEPDGDVAKMISERTIYIVPRLNPDGVEANSENVQRGNRLNDRPVDDDRDGRMNEDGPNDLDGDGAITVMRVPDDAGKWMVDPDEPRLLKKADPAKGERGVYKLVLEGIDDDHDGEINEDGPGGVDDDRNWPHLFESGVSAAGIHQLSEPETRALADFVIAHPNISAAIVYGRHDNVVKVPKGKQRGPAGKAYRDLHPDDIKLYEQVSEKYKEITGLKESPGGRPDGAFYSWIYAQRGIPSFATSLWWPLESEAKENATSQPASGPASRPADEADEQSETESEPPTAAPQELDPETIMARLREAFGDRQPTREEARAFFRTITGGGGEIRVRTSGGPPDSASQRRAGRRGRQPRGEQPASNDAKPAEPSDEALAARVESSKINRRWLKYSDEKRAGEGFAEWSEFDHPTLGRVEIGGFVPGFKTTPPAEELDEIADRQVAALVELARLLPAPRFGKAKVKDVGGGVWQVELGLVNDAYLSTHSGIARHIRLPGFAVRPRVDRERLLGGRPQEWAANVPGSGGVVTWKWLIRGSAGESIEFRAYNRVYGKFKTSVVLRETPPGGEDE